MVVNKRKTAGLKNELEQLREKVGLKKEIIKKESQEIKRKFRGLRKASLSNALCKLLVEERSTTLDHKSLYITSKKADSLSKEELVKRYNELLAVSSILQELTTYSTRAIEDCAVLLAGAANTNKKRVCGNKKTENKLSQLEKKLESMEATAAPVIQSCESVTSVSTSMPFMPVYNSNKDF